VRLAANDLETLGIYLFGPRWQRPLARAKHSDRLVRYWKSEKRPVSIAASRQIEALVRAKHGRQMRRIRAYYLDMVATLTAARIPQSRRDRTQGHRRPAAGLAGITPERRRKPVRGTAWIGAQPIGRPRRGGRLRPISPLALYPLAILWFGIGDASKLFVIALAAAFPVILNTFAGPQHRYQSDPRRTLTRRNGVGNL